MSLGEVLWTAFLVFIWVAWIWLVITVLIDIFRSDDLSGWGKAGWTVLVVFLTWIGVLAYLVVRGHGMQERRLREAAHMRRAQEEYIRDVAGGGSGGTADELSKLADLRDKGVISEDEFQSQKARLLS